MSESALEQAQRLVSSDRNSVYGDPKDNFDTTARLWDAYLDRRRASHIERNPTPFEILPIDVAVMMILVKVARLANTPDHPDSIVDIVGYGLTADTVKDLK